MGPRLGTHPVGVDRPGLAPTPGFRRTDRPCDRCDRVAPAAAERPRPGRLVRSWSGDLEGHPSVEDGPCPSARAQRSSCTGRRTRPRASRRRGWWPPRRTSVAVRCNGATLPRRRRPRRRRASQAGGGRCYISPRSVRLVYRPSKPTTSESTTGMLSTSPAAFNCCVTVTSADDGSRLPLG